MGVSPHHPPPLPMCGSTPLPAPNSRQKNILCTSHPPPKKSVLRKTKGSKTKQSKDLQPSLLLLPPRPLYLIFAIDMSRGGPDQPLPSPSPFYSVARQVLQGSRNLCHVWKSNNRSGAASYSFCVGGEECCCCCCCCGRLRIRFSLVLSNLERLFATGH